LYIKAGFAGDSEPQYVIDIDHFLNDIEWDFAFEVKSQRQLDQLEIGLEYLFQAMIETLLVDIKLQRVIVLSPTLLPTPIKRVICKVLCSTFLASSVIFHPQSVCTVIAAGIRAGLVVDIGYTQTVVTPVYDLRELVPRTRFSVRCGKHNLENVENGMPFDVSLNQCYFESHNDDDDDELSLPDLILQTIKNLETDVRGEMMNNVIFTGECIVPYLRATILNQLGVMYRAVETLGSWSGSSLYFAAVGWCLPQDRKLLGEISRDQVQRGNYSLDIN
jgi:actin-related protein